MEDLPKVQSELPETPTETKAVERKPIYKQKNFRIIFSAVALIFIVILVFLADMGFNSAKSKDSALIVSDFESCVKAGNPIAESYPATCRDNKGKVYTQRISPAPEQTELKTYTNPTYGFSFQYPAQGQVIDANGKMSAGVCGGAIKTTPISSYNYVLSVDNYFMVTEQPFKGTISQFIASYPGSNLFTTEALNIPGADEAVIISKKANASPTELMKSPFAYTLRIIKKGNEMFTIAAFQNNGNIGGCTPTNDEERNEVVNTLKFEN